ncbi:MAG: T9SS type A sorting domain-containing protein [Flavobacterium sp.]|nr:MAG: T9SS type A sorting domain-containing protein [Flavobacterium sp.]
MYVNDQVLYVKQDVNLQNNGNLYLRKEAQLLQGTAGNSTNSGAGKISVFQEGTSDNFDYNYWCSPVGNASALSGNESFGITLLNQPTSLTVSTPAIMLSMAALDGIASPLSIAPRWIYRYINSSLYSQWVLAGSTLTINPGEGFTMKGTSGSDATVVDGAPNNSGGAQRYDFRGKPNDGNISVTVGANNLTLTGNPYPSALHVNAFLLDPSNLSCTGIAYYWEQNKAVNSHYLQQYQGGYGSYSPVSPASSGIYVPATFDTYDGSGNTNTTGTSSGLVIERKYAPIGQGFMVKGTSNGILTLKNSHRSYYKESGPLSQFERSANTPSSTLSILRLNVSMNDLITRQIALALLPEATDGVDHGIDAESPAESDLPNDAFFMIGGSRYVIEGIAFDPQQRVKVGITSAPSTSFSFHLAEAVHFDENQPVYIYDGLDNSYHDLRNGSYNVTLDAGTYENRFELTFTAEALSNEHHQSQAFQVVQDNAHNQLRILNPSNATFTKCILYDVSGKQIFSKANLGSDNEYQFDTSTWSDGIYLFKAATDSGSTSTTKIAVMNNRN